MQSQDNRKFDKQFIQALKQNNQRYDKLKHIEKQQVFTKSSHDVQLNIIFCFNGTKYNSNNKKDTLFYVIRTIEEELNKLKNKFSIAFIYQSLSDFLQFRKLLHYFPQKFIRKIKDIYIVRPSFISKIIQKLCFGTFNNFIYQRSIYVDSIQQIQKECKVTFTGNTKQQNQPIPMLKSSHFKLIQNKLYGKQLSGYQISQSGIPIIIQRLIIRLYSTQRFLQAQGVMRKSCDIQQLQLLQKHMMEDKQSYQYMKNLNDPYVICGCLKKIFNNLFSPLFSYTIYDQIIAYRSTGKQEDDIDFLRRCLSKMQQVNLNVLIYLISFLKRGIVTFMEKNKMSSYNLAVVFGPCLFRPRQYSLQDLMNSGKCSKVILLLIDNLQKIVGEQKAINFYNTLDKQAQIQKISK